MYEILELAARKAWLNLEEVEIKYDSLTFHFSGIVINDLEMAFVDINNSSTGELLFTRRVPYASYTQTIQEIGIFLKGQA
jgi:hypothetical protein